MIIILFISFGCTGSLLAAHELSLVVASRGCSLAAVSRGCSLAVGHRVLLVVAFLVAHGPWHAGSVIAMNRPGCSVARRFFPDQGSNLCPLHQQGDSLPLDHHGRPVLLMQND